MQSLYKLAKKHFSMKVIFIYFLQNNTKYIFFFNFIIFILPNKMANANHFFNSKATLLGLTIKTGENKETFFVS